MHVRTAFGEPVVKNVPAHHWVYFNKRLKTNKEAGPWTNVQSMMGLLHGSFV